MSIKEETSRGGHSPPYKQHDLPGSLPLPAIIDCPDSYKPTQRQWRIGVITAIGMFSIALAMSLIVLFWPAGSSSFAKYSPWFFVVLILGLVLGRGYFAGRRYEPTTTTDNVIPSSNDAIIALCKPNFWDTGIRMRTLTRRLHAQGLVGRCVRICHVDSQFAVDPLTLPFEPIPLDQAEAGFANLMEQPAELKAHHGNDSKSTGNFSRINRNVLFAGGRLAVLLFGFIWLMHGIEALMKWQVTWPIIYWSVFFGIMLFGVGGRGAWTWRRQWMLVPGGVFTRKARFFQRVWESHIFPRTKSMLVLRNTGRNIWTACVSDDVNNSIAGMTRSEAQMLLRAWLSPLPTPPLEQLSDLT